jgi:MoxR-like ATPase
MSKYRFKTEEEFKRDGLWNIRYNVPDKWNEEHEMDEFYGQDIPAKYNVSIKSKKDFEYNTWIFQACDCIIKEEEPIDLLDVLKQINQNSLITKKTKMRKAAKITVENTTQKFVFMDKTINILNVGLSTNKNVVLYGPGGHGKSEITLDFLKSRGINPYIITMGTGMTTDRLFGGLDIPTFEKTGKIEYLVDNSFMNHEYVIFEELFDAPDFILEQLKDILSSGTFRNGTQIYDIKTKFIVCCTNRTRDEFSKNMSLKALMERFPLELNVIWDNYTEITYNKLLESKFGEGEVDPVIPYLLQEYAKNGITISPRVAVTAYQVYDECGPDALAFIAEFAKKPSLIAEAIKKFESTLKFRELAASLTESVNTLSSLPLSTRDDEKVYKAQMKKLEHQIKDIKGLTVSDDLASTHAELVKGATQMFEKATKELTIVSFL